MTTILLALLSFALQSAPAAKPPERFAATQPLAELQNKQAVLETDAGTIVIDLLPDAAPNHVAYFLKLAAEGAYNGTTFHRVIKYGIIQGGDPLSKDPAKRPAYGTGGLNVLAAEPGAGKHTAGTVSSVILPGRPDSGGAQFFICVVDQPALDGQYTAFGRVAEGMSVVRRISEAGVDENGRVVERIEIKSAVIRERPPEPPTFADEPAEQLAAYRAVVETSAGRITLAFRPDKAPGHVRNFLSLAAAGVYDGTTVHRVVRGFVIQGGSMNFRREPLNESQQRRVRDLEPEFNDLPHRLGTLSMARGDDPASASTSFFICTGQASSLDGKYTAFGEVVDGLSVVQAIEGAPVDGEAPRERIEIIKITVVKST
ncbi:MAG: peptidylprolyl isomerase [Acidobacteria bacterium]|nr:peptidylprolyl isomerase [Acidobacteriota bacterium]